MKFVGGVAAGMDREEALVLVKENVKNENILRHMLTVESIMKELAENLHEDVELWGMAGLLHDIDYGLTETNPKEHGIAAERILQNLVDGRVIRAIKAHNSKNTNVMPETAMEKALVSVDSISGLAVACALVMPSKKMEEVKVKTVNKKFKDRDFARGSDRERILLCESIGVPKEKLFELALKALKGISGELGL